MYYDLTILMLILRQELQVTLNVACLGPRNAFNYDKVSLTLRFRLWSQSSECDSQHMLFSGKNLFEAVGGELSAPV